MPEKKGILARAKYEVGDFMSTNQFVLNNPGRIPSGFGRERHNNRFHGGTIYNDAAFGLIWVKNQVSLGANKTIVGKARFEQWLWEQAVAEVSYYHSDNVIFVKDVYSKDCEGYISPKYHVFLYDLFETKVCRGDNNPVIYRICNDLFDSSPDWYAEEEYDPEGK